VNLAEKRAAEDVLLKNIKRDLVALTSLRDQAQSHWAEEDFVYRFYHQSFKVFSIQTLTTRIVDALRALLPERTLNEWFTAIVSEGSGKQFSMEMNRAWLATTRPLVEAFFHANYFLRMAVKYGNELDEPPSSLPSGWAALLYLYDIR
jgi:isocitrate dehydrogenase kinase/phosphatase